MFLTKSFRPSHARAAAMLALAAAAASCTSVQTPRSFSVNMTPCVTTETRTCPVKREVPQADKNFPLAVQLFETEQLRQEYIGYKDDLAGLSPTLNAGLIGATAWSLYRGIKHPDSANLAATGLLGSAAYAYGNQANPKQRQQIYLAGIAALTCAISIAKPYDFRDSKLRDLNNQVIADTENLRNVRSKWIHLNQTVVTTQAAYTISANCAANQKKLVCDGKADKAACDKANLDLAKACQDKTVAEKKTTTEPSDVYRTALTQTDDLLKEATERTASVSTSIGRIAKVTNQLATTRGQIEVAVGEELVKLEPDLSKIPATLQGLSATPLGAKPGAAQSGAERSVISARGAKPEEVQAIADLQKYGDALRLSNARLSNLQNEFEGRLPTAAELAKCSPQFIVTPAQVQVPATPAAAAVPVKLPDSPGTTAGKDIWQGLGFDEITGEGEQFNKRLIQCRLNIGLPGTATLDARTRDEILKGSKCKNLT